MLHFLLDIAPYPRRWELPSKEVSDTIDSISGLVEPTINTVQGGGNSGLPYILGGILAALVALGFLLFMVRHYRLRGEQQLAWQ